MKTFEKVLEIFQDYLSCDLEEEVLPCRNGYLRVTWNGDSRYCVDGLLSRTPDELFEVLLSDYSGSGNSGVDLVCMDLCGDRLYLRSGAGAYQHGDRPVGRGGPAVLFPAKRYYPAGDGISY